MTAPVVVHYPHWAVAKAELPSIDRFYARLFQALTAAGVAVRAVGQPGKPAELATEAGAVHIAYHTCLDQPGVYNAKIGYLPDFFTFDRTGYSGWAELARDPGLFDRAEAGIDQGWADRTVAELQDRYRRGGASKYAQPDQAFAHGRAYVFVALQVVDDTVAELAWLPTVQLCEAVAERYAGTGIDVAIKRHPKCRSPAVGEALDRLTRHDHVIRAEAGVQSLIAGAEAVFTVNSGVGFEALLQEKPVVASGASDYALACHRIASAHDLAALPDRPPPALAPERLRRFLAFYLYQYCLPLEDEALFARALFAKLEGGELAGARRVSQLRRAGLLLHRRVRRWKRRG